MKRHVGPFTVRQMTVPASVVNGPQEVQVGQDTVLRVSTAAPYVVFRRKLDSRRWTTVARLDCAQPPVWTRIEGPQAALLCAGPVGAPAAQNRLILIAASGAVSAYTLPVRLPVPPADLDVHGMAFGGTHGDLLWVADENTEPPVRYGSGLIALVGGKDIPIPAPLSGVATA